MGQKDDSTFPTLERLVTLEAFVRQSRAKRLMQMPFCLYNLQVDAYNFLTCIVPHGERVSQREREINPIECYKHL